MAKNKRELKIYTSKLTELARGENERRDEINFVRGEMVFVYHWF